MWLGKAFSEPVNLYNHRHRGNARISFLSLHHMFASHMWGRESQRTVRYSICAACFSVWTTAGSRSANQQACVCAYLDKPNSKSRQKLFSSFTAQCEEIGPIEISMLARSNSTRIFGSGLCVSLFPLWAGIHTQIHTNQKIRHSHTNLIVSLAG